MVIVAGGTGTRFGADLPKQYLPIAGRAVIHHTVRSFLSAGVPPQAIQIVVGAGMEDQLAAALIGLPDLLPPVTGGADRQASVLAGLEALTDTMPDLVMIHDAARPFVPSHVINQLIAAMKDHCAAIAALPVVDALQMATNGTIRHAVERENLWRAQTPQIFHYGDILDAHRTYIGKGLADDAAVAMAAGHEVKIVVGDDMTFKITHADDLPKAEAVLFLQTPDVRTGQGYDVHRFGVGDHVWLGGVRIEHTQSLIGHSDADVAQHALTDAILGALGNGDIGTHFPPSDDKWKGASSDLFLRHACNLVAARGGVITHLDLTLICEAPKIGPHREAMLTRLSEITGVVATRISVKATTTEKLGFTGRGEGIAAQALATIRLPIDTAAAS